MYLLAAQDTSEYSLLRSDMFIASGPPMNYRRGSERRNSHRVVHFVDSFRRSEPHPSSLGCLRYKQLLRSEENLN